VGVSMIVPVNKKTQITNASRPPRANRCWSWRSKTIPMFGRFDRYQSIGRGSWDGFRNDTLFAPGEAAVRTIGGLPSAFLSAEIRTLPIKQGGTGVITVSLSPGRCPWRLLVDHPLNFLPLKMAHNCITRCPCPAGAGCLSPAAGCNTPRWQHTILRTIDPDHLW
jgi:hypothetical protein